MISILNKTGALTGEVNLPYSKSMSNRLLILNYLHGGRISVKNLADSGDTVLMQDLLQQVRDYQEAGSLNILPLDADNSGTVMRFLTALLSRVPGKYLLTGSERMEERPLESLVQALRDLGANIEYVEKEGVPPLFIKGRLLTGGQVSVDVSETSQFASALLLIGPSLQEGIFLELPGEVISHPYIDMTLGIMDAVGLRYFRQENTIIVPPGEAHAVTFENERDWSSAAFFYGMMALARKGEIFFKGLKRTGLQGDRIVAEFFTPLGVKTSEESDGIYITPSRKKPEIPEFDFADHIDLALPVIVTCAGLGINGRFRGLQALKFKESDRLAALETELLKFGAELMKERGNMWKLLCGNPPKGKITIGSYNDHRVSMAFSMLSDKERTIVIPGGEEVSKSFPRFWNELQSLDVEVFVS